MTCFGIFRSRSRFLSKQISMGMFVQIIPKHIGLWFNKSRWICFLIPRRWKLSSMRISKGGNVESWYLFWRILSSSFAASCLAWFQASRRSSSCSHICENIRSSKASYSKWTTVLFLHRWKWSSKIFAQLLFPLAGSPQNKITVAMSCVLKSFFCTDANHRPPENRCAVKIESKQVKLATNFQLLFSWISKSRVTNVAVSRLKVLWFCWVKWVTIALFYLSKDWSAKRGGVKDITVGV